MTDTQTHNCSSSQQPEVPRRSVSEQHATGRSIAIRRILFGSLIGFLWCFPGFPMGAEEPGRVKQNRPPELSLETLFHPQQKHRFADSVPTTHWLGESPPELLLKREKAWTRFDPNSGQETPWPIFEQLTQRLSALEGIKEGQAHSAAMGLVGKMKQSGDKILARIDGSLAVVSADSPARWLTRDANKWNNAALDPAGRRVAYTYEGDLFVVDVATGRSLRVTRDGSDTLRNGILDWTYQEEIFGRGNYKGFWFSPDGEWLAMLRIDISGIEPYTLASASSDRGKGIVRRYPKAGDPIPQASLWLWDLRQFDEGVLPPPRSLAESSPQQERIITGVWWHAHQRSLLFCLSDRRQTWRELQYVSEPFMASDQGEPVVLLREESPAWVEPPTVPGWLTDGSIVWRSELPTGHNRLYRISPDGAIVTPISPENFDVHDFLVRSDGAFAIVTGDAQGGTVQRHAYRIDMKHAASEIPQLVAVTTEPGWHSTQVSPDGEFVSDNFSSPRSHRVCWFDRRVQTGQSRVELPTRRSIYVQV